MTYLIDTHVLIWYIVGSSKLNKLFVTEIRNPVNQIYISKASIWEIVIKVGLGKLKLEIELSELENYLVRNRILELNFGYNEFNELENLPFHHRDPFDRLIIAQAITNRFTIITDDSQFHLYPVQLLKN